MACTCGPTVGDFLAMAGVPSFEELIGDLAWLDCVDFNARYCNVRGIIKPDPDLALRGKDPARLRAQLMDSYNEIVKRLEQAEVPSGKTPELELTGNVYLPHAGGREFMEIEARIRIELVVI